eukprot:CAMPEP_0185775598 /NCGR_PEP_ID=MMETSP1174-20130828/82608_1 /TAXON_ID=35687 /ORGANISM="Dictyocha speculum, Strain CCMP1381" /LENGTH=113 /DNA_ID=CAMNT_0028463237 /DNA_START=229 /DNA_END=567 /DNA_ORIENTATION=+
MKSNVGSYSAVAPKERPLRPSKAKLDVELRGCSTDLVIPFIFTNSIVLIRLRCLMSHIEERKSSSEGLEQLFRGEPSRSYGFTQSRRVFEVFSVALVVVTPFTLNYIITFMER